MGYGLRGIFLFLAGFGPLFLLPEIDPCMSRNCPARVLSVWHEKRDNIAMEEMLKYLKTIGLSDEQCAEIREKYDGDLDGLTEYVLICVAHYDDRHEYV